MRRIAEFLADGLHRIALGIFLVALTGCAATKNPSFFQAHPERELEGRRFAVENDDVIGRLALIRVKKGDTLADVARHFGVGINAIHAANPGVDVWVPRDGERITLPTSFILPNAPRKGIVVNLAAMRLFHFNEQGGGLTVSTYPVGVGTRERPTPTGQMHVARKLPRPTWFVPASIAEDHRKKGDPLPAKVPPGPENPLGEYALYLSKPGYLIHGTNKPASIGLKATNGCLRLYPEHIETLYQDTPVHTPVVIVDQPYLVGQRDGVLYLEAHRSAEDADPGELEKIEARLRAMESETARPLDWNKVREVQAEARGIPVPIMEMREGAKKRVPKALKVAHPGPDLYGRPPIPELSLHAWYVFAGEMPDEVNARKMAAIINHQGPPIPARVLARSSRNGGYRVIAGPFEDRGEAIKALKRLKIDLDIDGIVIEPVEEIEQARSLLTERR